MLRTDLLLLAMGALAGCTGEDLLHGLDERQVNEVLVALGEGGVRGEKDREDGAEGTWRISVPKASADVARRILADRALPRTRPPGFSEVFAKGSMVPSPTEEHALYLHALAGELARSVESIDGIVAARVHVGLPEPDPLRAGERPPPRASVLAKCRAAACEAVRGQEPGIRALVAGAVDGLDPAAVSVVIAEAAASPHAAPAPRRRASAILLALAGGAAIAAVAVAALGLRTRRERATGTA